MIYKLLMTERPGIVVAAEATLVASAAEFAWMLSNTTNNNHKHKNNHMHNYIYIYIYIV